MKIIKISILILLVSLTSCKDSQYNHLKDGMYAEIQTDGGNILLELEYRDMPITVGNFVSLAEGNNRRVEDSMKGKPFYNGLKFHRVISKVNGDSKDFIIQGGDPLGTGMGDPGYRFDDEFPLDSIGGLLFKHDKPGVLSMANSGPGTNGSQFFITLVPIPHLNGKHSIFGHVVEGQSVVDSLLVNTVMNKLKIIRVGDDAENFEAYEVFDEELKRSEKIEQERQAKNEILKAEFLKEVEVYKTKATELPSGLKIYLTKKGSGVKPKLETPIRVHYAVYFPDGELLDTNYKDVAEEYGVYSVERDRQRGYEPFASKYSMNVRLIQGFKEGLQNMKFGDKAIIFVPYHLGYGEQGNRGVPPKTDLIFELEMFPPVE
ncbi:peptidylprolyl isomerase [Urechidicola croceus]|uniref:peptidylprolyl isomerase n=1 Tax=Urechidicola croceus TaxID=1850246 RepID=A0A1D8P5W2_9FLAO|nr:peptidylprolyl isomerase [Urechidicola croceus]AOW19966.1 hypothetical protein LPB138_04380 [Urechidicola croceus]